MIVMNALQHHTEIETDMRSFHTHQFIDKTCTIYPNNTHIHKLWALLFCVGLKKRFFLTSVMASIFYYFSQLCLI